jgi:AraC family transcriptional regulator of arabinose operon
MPEKQLNEQDYCILGQPIPSLIFTLVGDERCKPGHFNGPKMREHFIFHYIVSGEGDFQIGNQKYRLHANQGFLIPDSSIIYYKADEKNPWHYCWFIIKGAGARKFFEDLKLSAQNPIYNAKPENDVYSRFLDLLHSAKDFDDDPYKLYGSLYKCMRSIYNNNADFQEPSTHNVQKQYIEKAELFMGNNYHREELAIEHVADHVGLNRSYLTRIFKQHLNVSPQAYLIKLRMEKAKELLANTPSSISIIARSVGYENVFTFSKMYKKYYDCSPKDNRFQKKDK